MNKYIIEYIDPILQHIEPVEVYAQNEYDAIYQARNTGIDYYKLKLDSDNCIILSAVETCEHPFKRLHWVGTKVYCNKCKTTLTKPIN